ncbi:MAG: hypothetical protein ACMXYG_03275 [Candidatus Woesearchaeota archaeon]
MTISLPATWVKKYSLQEGDELTIDETGNTIQLSTGKASSKRNIEIDATQMGNFTKNDLSHLYILGFDEIIIRYNNDSVIKSIKERVPDCIGYEIIDQTEKSVTIKSISSELEEEFDNILRKVFLIMKEMAEGIYQSLKEKNFSRLKQIQELETINNKFTSFLLRLISKKGYKRQDRSLQAYDLIQNLERLADEYRYICEDYVNANNKKEISSEALSLLKEINNYFITFYELFYKYDSVKKDIINKQKNELSNKAKELFKRNKDIILCHHLISLVEKIRNTSGSYLAMNVE